jgi:hypothetical protein
VKKCRKYMHTRYQNHCYRNEEQSLRGLSDKRHKRSSRTNRDAMDRIMKKMLQSKQILVAWKRGATVPIHKIHDKKVQ